MVVCMCICKDPCNNGQIWTREQKLNGDDNKSESMVRNTEQIRIFLLVLNGTLHTLFNWSKCVSSKGTYVFYCHHVLFTRAFVSLSISVLVFFPSIQCVRVVLFLSRHIFLYVLHEIEDWNWNEEMLMNLPLLPKKH